MKAKTEKEVEIEHNEKIAKTEKKLEEILQETELCKAVEGIADLMKNYNKHYTTEVVSYSRKTGRPEGYKLKPYEKFTGIIPLDYHNDDDIGLSKQVLNYLFEMDIKNKALAMGTKYGPYVVCYFVDIGEHGREYKTLLVRPFRKISTKKSKNHK